MYNVFFARFNDYYSENRQTSNRKNANRYVCAINRINIRRVANMTNKKKKSDALERGIVAKFPATPATGIK